MTQCRSWKGHSRVEQGRYRCIKETGHEDAHLFEILPMETPRYRRGDDGRCKQRKSKTVNGMRLVWRCVNDAGCDEHAFRVAPDFEEAVG